MTVRPNLDSSMLKEIHRALALDFMEVKDLKKAESEANLVLKFDKKNILGAGFFIDLPALGGNTLLREKNINVHTLIEF